MQNNSTSKIRRLRICNKSFSRGRSGYVVFPDIRLCGKWLLESGFAAGQHILIDHSHDRIVITRQPLTEPGKGTK